MPREAALSDTTGGSVVEALLLLRAEGANIPPAWIDRAQVSRKKREAALAVYLADNSLDAIQVLRDRNSPTAKSAFTTAFESC